MTHQDTNDETTQALNYTPQPWTYSDGSIWGVSVWNANVRLADIRKHASMNAIDSDANGKLMAAAPAMHMCLQGILDSLTQNKTFPADIENAIRLAKIGLNAPNLSTP